MYELKDLDARAVFGAIKSNWDNDRLKTLLEKEGLGYDGVVEILKDLKENGDSRTKIKVAQLILEIGGALKQNETGTTNIMINNIINAPQKELEHYIKKGQDVLKSAEVKNIETKEEE